MKLLIPKRREKMTKLMSGVKFSYSISRNLSSFHFSIFANTELEAEKKIKFMLKNTDNIQLQSVEEFPILKEWARTKK